MKKIVMRAADILMSYLIAFTLAIGTIIILSIIFAPGATTPDIKSSGKLTKSPYSGNTTNFAYNVKSKLSYPMYSRNEYGQTYGSIFDIPDDPYMENIVYPELFLAVGTNGTIGYVYTSDLNADNPTNPDEATEYMKKKEEAIKNCITGKIIFLYEVDGRTIIGEFKIQYK